MVSHPPPLENKENQFMERWTSFAWCLHSKCWFSAWHGPCGRRLQMENRMGYDHYVGGDSESDEIRQAGDFVVVCGYGRIGKLVCELLGKKFINFVAFDNNPLKAMEARNR